MTMTPRQRVEAVLKGEPADHVPLTMYESKIPQCAVERQLRNDGLCIVNRSVPVARTHQPNVKVETHTYVENGVQLVRQTFSTPVGEVHAITRPAGFTSWHVAKRFKRPEDYKVLRFMAEDTHVEPNYEAFLAGQEWMGEDVILRPGLGSTPLHEIMIGEMGVETFAVEWAERRDEIDALCDALVERQRKIYPIVAASPALHANYGGNETGDVMGRERFEQYVLPSWQEAAEAMHKHGKLVGSHLDGQNKVWADLVAASPLDYIEAFTPAPDTDMSLKDALDTWPDKVVWINFTSSAHLQSVEGVEQTARDLLRQAVPGDRLLVGVTEDVPQDRWQRNTLAISRVLCDDGRLPLRA